MSYTPNLQKLSVNSTGKVASAATADSATTSQGLAVVVSAIKNNGLLPTFQFNQTTPFTITTLTELIDNTNSYNPTTGVFTVPSNGVYLFCFNSSVVIPYSYNTLTTSLFLNSTETTHKTVTIIEGVFGEAFDVPDTNTISFIASKSCLTGEQYTIKITPDSANPVLLYGISFNVLKVG